MILSISLLSWKTWAVPFIGAFIGWITNWLAIKMLFHPRKPIKILFITFHGIFPKNKPRIAEKLGTVVQSIHKTIVDEIEKNLPTVIGSSIDKIEEKLDIQQLVRNKVANFSDEKLEQLLLDITAREFTFIEVIGGVLGFIIGIIQLLISAL